MSDRKKAIETLKENLCAMCAYGSQNMESCDIRSCDNRDAIKALDQEPTTKNDLGVDCISREQAKEAIRDKFKDLSSRVEINTILNELPSVTPQLSSELEKNFGESDCISRAEVLKLMQDNWHTHNGDWAMQESMDDIRALPAVTAIRAKDRALDRRV